MSSSSRKSQRFNINNIFTESTPSIEVNEDSKFENLSFPSVGTLYHSSTISDPFKSLVQYNIKLNGENDREINGKVYQYQSGKCKGCKQCTVDGCTVVYHLNSKKTMCPLHGSQLKHMDCNTKYYVGSNKNDQFIYSCISHSHRNPPPRKIPPSQRQEMAAAFQNNNTLTAKDLSLGIGIDEIPSIENRACANISRIQNIKRKAIKLGGSSPSLVVMKVEDERLVEYQKKIKDVDPSDIKWVRNIVNDLDNNVIHTQFPFFSKVINEKVNFLVIDLKHKSKSGPFYHHLGISSFIEEHKGGMSLQLCRILMEEQTYQDPFLLFLNTLEKDGCNLSELFEGPDRKIKGILVDFSQFQLKGLKDAFRAKFGEKADGIVDELVSGCFVHFLRSAKRLVNSLPIEQEYRDLVFKMLEEVKEFKTEEEIVHIINAIELFCPGAKSWCDWWRQPHILKLLVAKSSQENGIPRHTNHQEILNVNVPTFGGNYVIETEKLLREDMLALIRLLSLCSGVELSYRNTTKEGREKRNVSRKQAKFDSRPADTVARGLVPTNVSSLSVFKNFVQGVEELEKKKLIEFAGVEADDLNDKDFTPTPPGSSIEHAKQTQNKRAQKKGQKRKTKPSTQSNKKSKVIRDESSSESYSESSSDGFDSSSSTSTSEESDTESDSNRESEIFTRSKGLIGDPNRSESAQLKSARKHGVESSKRKSL